MTKRNRLLPFCLAALLIGGTAALTPPGTAAADPDPLWPKAVETASANRNLTPGTSVVLTEELDGKGKVTHAEETRLRWFLGPDNQVATEIVQALADGRDVTAERREKAKKAQQNGKNGTGSSGLSINTSAEIPFYDGSQHSVTFKALHRDETVQNSTCAVYEYSYAKDAKTTLKGTAWLEEPSGVPVQIRYSPDPLPKMVKRLQTTIIFSNDPDGRFYPAEIKVEGSGGLLLFQKNLRMTMKCGGYWKYP